MKKNVPLFLQDHVSNLIFYYNIWSNTSTHAHFVHLKYFSCHTKMCPKILLQFKVE